jgi:ornithine cyclodeaminase/alanine dehydrogenase-like protein (mu-crystallin family)
MAAADGRYFGAKIYSTHPRHGARFLVLLYRAEDAAPLALLEANYLGQIRTGAASGFATSMLARPNSRTIGIIGSGFQARAQLEAMFAWKPFERVRVWSRSPERRSAFVAEFAGRFEARIEAADTAQETVSEADVVITATNSAHPVLESAWILPGDPTTRRGANFRTIWCAGREPL